MEMIIKKIFLPLFSFLLFVNTYAALYEVKPQGNLKTLIIFAMFSDDTRESNGWNLSLGDTLPSWGHTFISSETTEPKIFNLSQYFYEMSNGRFLVYGDVFPKVVIPDSSEAWYVENGGIRRVNEEILEKVNQSIDFSLYDNVGDNADSPDGKVDLICIIYRNFSNELVEGRGWTGNAFLYLSEPYKTDGVFIRHGFHSGSGLQVREGYNGGTYTKYVVAHEIGHHIFGAGHIEGVSRLALMTGGPVWNASRGMHSWEREHLGWISIPEIKNDTTIYLTDYMTTGFAVKIPLREGEYYVLENHQHKSIHDQSGDKGIYIYYVKERKGRVPKIEVLSAEGHYDFKVNDSLTILEKKSPNPKGKNELNVSIDTNGKYYACYKPFYPSGDAWGDTEDAFDRDDNNVLSPWSNPSTKQEDFFAIEIGESMGDSVKVSIYHSNPIAAVPSKPQNIQVIEKDEGWTLSWECNKEPDVVNGGFYEITIGVRDSIRSSFFVRKEIPIENISIIENNCFYSLDNIIKLGGLSMGVEIQLRAIDSSGKKSPKTTAVQNIAKNLEKSEKIDCIE